MTRTRFELGQIVATPAALAAIEAGNESPATYLARHEDGDWGEICESDGRLNDEAIHDGSRILSVYRTSFGATIWIITEAVDEDGRRLATTILLPEDY